MITKFATYLNIDNECEPNLSADQAAYQRELIELLRNDLRTLCDPASSKDSAVHTALLRKFNFGVDYLRRYAFPNLRAEIPDLLNANPPADPPAHVVDSLTSTPGTQPPAPSAEPSKSHASNSKPSPVPYREFQRVPEPSFEDNPEQSPLSKLSARDIQNIEISERNRAGLLKFFGPIDGPKILNLSPEEVQYLQNKYFDPAFDPEPPQTVESKPVAMAVQSADSPLDHPGPVPVHPGPNAVHPGPFSTFDLATIPIQRADHSPLDDILPENQDKIMDLIERGYPFEKLAKLISSPPPKGLGIPTSKTSVIRFRDRRRDEERAENLAASHRSADQVAAQLASQNKFVPASIHLLQTKLFDATREKELPLDQINHLTRSLCRLNSMALAERKLNLSEATSHASPA